MLLYNKKIIPIMPNACTQSHWPDHQHNHTIGSPGILSTPYHHPWDAPLHPSCLVWLALAWSVTSRSMRLSSHSNSAWGHLNTITLPFSVEQIRLGHHWDKDIGISTPLCQRRCAFPYRLWSGSHIRPYISSNKLMETYGSALGSVIIFSQ